jgi:signal transduction histidine kinase
VGHATVPNNAHTLAGKTLTSSEVVVVDELSGDDRFEGSTLLLGHGVRSSMSAVIQGGGKPFGVLGAHSAQPRKFTSDEVNFLQATANVLSSAIQRRRAEESLRRLSGRLLHLQDEERRRIARELHDSTGQALAALAMNLSVLKENSGSLPPRSLKALNESLALLDACSGEIRTLSYLLHPPLLDEVGLETALRWYVDGFAERSGVRVELEVDPGLGRLGQQVETTLFRIVQECLSNVHRHSGSPTARIEVTRWDSTVRLRVSDAGRGILKGTLERLAGETGALGVGIPGMRERLKQFKGDLQIESGSHGTTVSATLPLQRRVP